jgi:hypothetical protein
MINFLFKQFYFISNILVMINIFLFCGSYSNGTFDAPYIHIFQCPFIDTCIDWLLTTSVQFALYLVRCGAQLIQI